MEAPALDDGALAALRRAAVMAHTLGSVALRLTAGPDVIVDVVPGRTGGRDVAAPRAIDPCGFRLAVARAWADHRAGREIRLIGHPAGGALEVAWSVAPPGAVLGLGAVRAVCAGRLVWAFASLLGIDEVTEALADVEAPHVEVRARLVRDDLLDATVVHVEGDLGLARVLDETLRRLVAVVGAHETVLSFGIGPFGPMPNDRTVGQRWLGPGGTSRKNETPSG